MELLYFLYVFLLVRGTQAIPSRQCAPLDSIISTLKAGQIATKVCSNFLHIATSTVGVTATSPSISLSTSTSIITTEITGSATTVTAPISTATSTVVSTSTILQCGGNRLKRGNDDCRSRSSSSIAISSTHPTISYGAYPTKNKVSLTTLKMTTPSKTTTISKTTSRSENCSGLPHACSLISSACSCLGLPTPVKTVTVATVASITQSVVVALTTSTNTITPTTMVTPITTITVTSTATTTSCPCTTAPLTSLCGQTCVDFNSDKNNCGSCGNVCGTDYACTNGACTFTCKTNQQTCTSNTSCCGGGTTAFCQKSFFSNDNVCCNATDQPCDISHPEQCCSGTCGVKPSLGSGYYCY